MGEQKSKKIYLAGPMKGYDQFNFPSFDKAAGLGRSLGHEIISPAEMDRSTGFDERKNSLDGLDLKAAKLRDIDAIKSCDAVALLPGWEKSTGAKTELAIATWLGLEILDASTFEPFVKAERKFRTVLDEAKGLVHGDRNKSYGNPTDDFSRTAGMLTSLFSTYLKEDAAFKPEDIARIQICVKLSRSTHSNKRDNAVDIAGYAETLDWVLNG